MLTVTMKPNGDIMLCTPESEYPTGYRLKLRVGKTPETPDHLLTAMEEAVYDAICETVTFSFVGNHAQISHFINVEAFNTFIGKIKNGITDELKGRGITSFMIEPIA